jgi:glycosyltransferase involved in cell wall biosynthesis
MFRHRVSLVYDAHELTPAMYSEWFSETIGKLVYVIEKRLISHADYVITVNHFLAQYYKSITESPLIVIPNFPEKKSLPKESKRLLRLKLQLPPDGIIISFVGMLRHVYALFELLSAADKYFNEFGTKDIYFLLVGYGPMKEAIYSIIRSREVNKIFILKEKVLKNDSLKYIKASDYSYVVLKDSCINTKYSSPWKLFESLACGTKLIVNEGTYAASYARKNFDVIIDAVTADSLLKAFSLLSEGEAPPSEDYFWEQNQNKLLEAYHGLEPHEDYETHEKAYMVSSLEV